MGNISTEFDRFKAYFDAATRADLEKNIPAGMKSIRTYDTWKRRKEIPFKSLEVIAKDEGIDDPVAWATYIKSGIGEFSRKEQRGEAV